MERGQAPVEEQVKVYDLAGRMVDVDNGQRVDQDGSDGLAPISNTSGLQLATSSVSVTDRTSPEHTSNHRRPRERRRRQTWWTPPACLQRYAESVVRFRRQAR